MVMSCCSCCISIHGHLYFIGYFGINLNSLQFIYIIFFWVSVHKWEQFVYNERVIIVITSFLNSWASTSVFTEGG